MCDRNQKSIIATFGQPETDLLTNIVIHFQSAHEQFMAEQTFSISHKPISCCGSCERFPLPFNPT